MGADTVDDILAEFGIDVDGIAPKDTANHHHHDTMPIYSLDTPMVETSYEGWTIRPLTPLQGDKKTWYRVSKVQMPFDSPKLFTQGTKHLKSVGKDVTQIYATLTADQQGVVDRIIKMKMMKERNDNGIWEPFDIKRIKKEVPINIFRTDVKTVALEIIIRHKDKRNGKYSDRPTGTTTNPFRTEEDIIDLTIPLIEELDYVKVSHPKKNKDKKKDKHEDEHKGKPHEPDVQNPDPLRYQWNGTFYEEKSQDQILMEQTKLEQAQHQRDMVHRQMNQEKWEATQREKATVAQWQRYQQTQQQMMMKQQQLEQLRQANPQQQAVAQIANNPFHPHGSNPEQYADVTYDPRYQTAARERSRSRRRRSLRARPASEDSSDYSERSEFVPEDEREYSRGSLNDRGQRYYKERRQRYPNERVTLYPGQGYGPEDYRRTLPERPRRRIEVDYVDDDFPDPTRRLTNYPEHLENAEYIQARRRSSVNEGYRTQPFREVFEGRYR